MRCIIPLAAVGSRPRGLLPGGRAQNTSAEREGVLIRRPELPQRASFGPFNSRTVNSSTGPRAETEGGGRG